MRRLKRTGLALVLALGGMIFPLEPTAAKPAAREDKVLPGDNLWSFCNRIPDGTPEMKQQCVNDLKKRHPRYVKFLPLGKTLTYLYDDGTPATPQAPLVSSNTPDRTAGSHDNQPPLSKEGNFQPAATTVVQTDPKLAAKIDQLGTALGEVKTTGAKTLTRVGALESKIDAIPAVGAASYSFAGVLWWVWALLALGVMTLFLAVIHIIKNWDPKLTVPEFRDAKTPTELRSVIIAASTKLHDMHEETSSDLTETKDILKATRTELASTTLERDRHMHDAATLRTQAPVLRQTAAEANERADIAETAVTKATGAVKDVGAQAEDLAAKAKEVHRELEPAGDKKK